MRAPLGGVGQDLRYTLRSWRRRPWFTAALLTMLALGIAAVAGIFAIAYADGLPCAWFAARVLTALLYATKPDDSMAYVSVTTAFAAVTLLAAYLPARRACSTDPAITLRCE